MDWCWSPAASWAFQDAIVSCDRLESSLLEGDKRKLWARPTGLPEVGSRGKPAKPRGMVVCRDEGCLGRAERHEAEEISESFGKR